MKSFQALRSLAVLLTSFHDLPVPLISSSIALRHVLFSLPLLPYPCVFKSIAPVSLRNACPVQFHFLLFIWFPVDFCWVILHNSSFVFLSVHFILIIRLKHLFTNFCSFLIIWLVLFQVSQACNNTDFTFVLNIRILTPFDMLWFLHTGCSWTNSACYIFLSGNIASYILSVRRTRCRSCLRQCATSRQVAGSVPSEVIGIFYSLTPSGHVRALGSTQPLIEISSNDLSWG